MEFRPKKNHGLSTRSGNAFPTAQKDPPMSRLVKTRGERSRGQWTLNRNIAKQKKFPKGSAREKKKDSTHRRKILKPFPRIKGKLTKEAREDQQERKDDSSYRKKGAAKRLFHKSRDGSSDPKCSRSEEIEVPF